MEKKSKRKELENKMKHKPKKSSNLKTQQWTWWELLPELCGKASICASSAVSPDEGFCLW